MTKPKGSLDNAALCRFRGHAEEPHAFPMIFRYLHRPHRTREIAPRAHPVPQLVEVAPQPLLEQADARPRPRPAPRYWPGPSPTPPRSGACDLKRLHLRLGSCPRLLPRRVGLGLTLVCAAPSLQPHYRTFTATTSRPAPVPRLGTLPLAVSAAWGPPSRGQRADVAHRPGRSYRGDRFSCSMPAPATSSRHLYTGHRQGSTQAAPWLRARHRRAFVPGATELPRF